MELRWLRRNRDDTSLQTTGANTGWPHYQTLLLQPKAADLAAAAAVAILVRPSQSGARIVNRPTKLICGISVNCRPSSSQQSWRSVYSVQTRVMHVYPCSVRAWFVNRVVRTIIFVVGTNFATNIVRQRFFI